MSELKLLLGVVVLFICVIAVCRNNDLMSPAKFYLLYTVFFYGAIYFTEVSGPSLIVYIVLLLSILLVVLTEPGGEPIKFKRVDVGRRVYISIWLLTLPGIAVKVYFIVQSGGVIGYLNLLGLRVQEWRGQGHLIMWFYMVPALNLLYFVYLIYDERRSKVRWLLYSLHFMIFLAIGVLTASRSFVAMTVVGMVVGYNYFVRRISLTAIVSIAMVVSIFVGVNGAVRNLYGGIGAEGFKLSHISAGLQEMESTHFSYGLIPLEIIFNDSNELRELYVGSTYFSLFTNLIPRSIYPDKPRTGGIAFTQDYANDEWGGLSHLATGAVTEGVINFGYFFGVLFGLLLNLVLFVFGIFLYKTLKQNCKLANTNAPIYFVCYFYTVLSISRFSFAEFTDLWQSLLIFCVIPCCFVLFLSGAMGCLGRLNVETNSGAE